jgi:hypothetical protein
MANIFDITWSTVTSNLTPWFWRETVDNNETKLLTYLRSMIKPIQDISDNLLTLQTETVDFLQYTGQHKVLEEYLNDLYDPTLRRIFITENDIAPLDPIDIYISGETTSTPLEIYLSGETPLVPVVIYQSNEVLIDNNFTVNVPASISFDILTMTNQLKNYTEATKVFNIVTF